MALEIKQLGSGTIVSGTPKDPLFAAPIAGKAQIIKNMRFVNKSVGATAKISLYLQGVSGGPYRICPIDVSIPPGGMYVDQDEITLEATQSLKAIPTASGADVDYVISGIQRDA